MNNNHIFVQDTGDYDYPHRSARGFCSELKTVLGMVPPPKGSIGEV